MSAPEGKRGGGRPGSPPWRRRRKPKLGDYARDVRGAIALARRRWKIGELRPEQEAAVEALLAGRDVLAVLPTGYGKSLIYQVPAVLTERPTIVVSPLIALMADQERSMKQRGFPVVRLDSTVRSAERRAALERIAASGSVDRPGSGRLIVLTTPETLESRATRDLFAASKPWLLCVDEAHCISEWGHDFRPSYLRLAAEREALGHPVVLALTATATPRVRDDVIARLAMRDPLVVATPPVRPNLFLAVEPVTAQGKPEVAGQLIRRLPRPGIVYCSTTASVDSIFAALDRARIPSARYHGKMATAEREASQKRFMKPSRELVMVATSAFGMGIDKPDIRWILHYQCPGSLEQYVQEFGRAGRDGRPSRCVLLYDPEDLRIHRHLQKQGRASADQLVRVTDALRAWAGEGRAASAAELALSASVPQTTCRSVCDALEELGLVEIDAERKYRVVVDLAQLEPAARDLARRLETQRQQDEAHLEALDDYAKTLECRGVFIRRYFGEPDPPRCGNCDRCGLAQTGRTGRRGRRRSAPA